jgi:hypothetical protein
MKRNLIYGITVAILCMLYSSKSTYAQCCAVGGGNPMAGDASLGVLAEKQLELSSVYQHISTTKFLNGSAPDTNFLSRFSSDYTYNRIAFGVTNRLTMSVEIGYWLGKRQDGLRNDDTYATSGFGDLILMPRYNLMSSSENTGWNELSAGMGIKIPIGSFNDSVGHLEPFSGETYYTNMPPAVQPSSGSQDIIFNLFYANTNPSHKLKLSANVMYIRKGWNPIGEKFGDFASLGIFVGKSFRKKLNLALQIKGEWIDKMQINEDILMYAFPNYDPDATGSMKVFASPQLSYSFRSKIILFLQGDIPVYQYVNKTQIASQYQMSLGLTYRFRV